MYRFSRSIYRELAPALVPAPDDPAGRRGREELLTACEATIERLAFDRNFTRPARSLFEQVRRHFPLTDQGRVRRVIERNLELAIEHIRRLTAAELEGLERRCVAQRRDGTPCQRKPTPDGDHCPSHRHLAEPAPVPTVR